MYTWDETVAGNGSQEIASCICRHINEVVPEETEQIIFTATHLLVGIAM